MTVKIHKNLATKENREAWLEARQNSITSSDVAAIFGRSPYKTLFELWAEKTGQIEDGFKENDRAAAGRHLEAGIASWACEKFGFEAKPFKDYYEDPDAKTGASFDWQITGWSDAPSGFSFDDVVPMEIKMVDYRVFNGTFKEGYADKKWDAENPDDIVAPPHIELQVQHQMMMTGASWAVIIVLIAGNDLRMILRKRNETIIQKIRDGIAKFWKDVRNLVEPSPNYERDADAIKRLYARPDPRAALDAPEAIERLQELFFMTNEISDKKKDAEKKEKVLKAEIQDVLREVEFVILPDGAKVSWKADKNGRRTLRLTPSVPFNEAA